MTDSEALDKLSFDKFTVALKKCWLKTGWEADVVTSIIRSHQADRDLFEDWVVTLKKKNTLLKGSAHYFNSICLCGQITANAVDDMYEAANLDSICDILDFKEWKEALACVDAQRVKDRTWVEAHVNIFLADKAANRVATVSLGTW